MNRQNLLLAEYRHFAESFWKSEEIGEKRVNFLIMLVTAVAAALVTLYTNKTSLGDSAKQAIVIGALLGVLTFGAVTLLRILQRDRVTDEYKAIVDYIREQLRRLAHFDDYELPFRPPRHWLIRGGLAKTVAVMNSVIVAALASLTCLWYEPVIFGWTLADAIGLVAPSAFVLSLAGQGFGISRRSSGKSSPCQTFRTGAGAVIVNSGGLVLALERLRVPGAWQMPQGGLEVGEDPLNGAYREIREETGILSDDLQVLSNEPRLLAYELPPSYRHKKTGRGQVHYWFLLRFTGDETKITLGECKEFKAWKWVSLQDLADQVVDFRRHVYVDLLEHFTPLLSEPQ